MNQRHCFKKSERPPTHLLSPRAISSPGVVTRHKLALCRAQKVSADAVIAKLIDRLVMVIQPNKLNTTYEYGVSGRRGALIPSKVGGRECCCRTGGTPSAPRAVNTKMRPQIKPRRLNWLTHSLRGRQVTVKAATTPAIPRRSRGVARAMTTYSSSSQSYRQTAMEQAGITSQAFAVRQTVGRSSQLATAVLKGSLLRCHRCHKLPCLQTAGDRQVRSMLVSEDRQLLGTLSACVQLTCLICASTLCKGVTGCGTNELQHTKHVCQLLLFAQGRTCCCAAGRLVAITTSRHQLAAARDAIKRKQE